MTARTRRPAFTLIELLVVVSIIAVLAALTATAVFAVRRGAQTQNAEATLTKIDGKLLQKIKDTQQRVQDDLQNRAGPEYPEVYRTLNACGGDKDRAKAVLMYARLRKDLPMTFAEAKNGFTLFTGTGNQFTYTPSPAFADLPNAGPADIEESAACLYAALAQNVTGTDGLDGQITTTASGRKVFTDGFGQPIGFVRLGYDGNANELNKPTQAFDPFYPNKTGAGAYRNLAADFPGGAATFETQVWDVVRPTTVTWVAIPADYPGLKHHTAFCFSAGANGKFPETPSNTIFDGDNLFSYRLRQEGARGD